MSKLKVENVGKMYAYQEVKYKHLNWLCATFPLFWEEGNTYMYGLQNRNGVMPIFEYVLNSHLQLKLALRKTKMNVKI